MAFRLQLTKSLLFTFAAAALAACTVTLPGGVTQGPRVNTNAPVVVGLLVPTGSEDAQKTTLGQSLINAAKLAQAEAPGVEIDLRVYGTAGSATTAAQVAQQAQADGAKILLGPLFGDAAAAAGSTVSATGLNVLSFSNNPQIASGNVFVLGDTFDTAARRVTGAAVAQGRTQIGLAAQNGTTGDVAISALQSAAAAKGATVVGVVRYDLTTEGVVASIDPIKSLINTGGAQALMLDANAAGSLPLYAQLLPEGGVTASKTPFLGLARWDQAPEQIRSVPGLQGSLFAMPDTTAQSAFDLRYQGTYGTQPHFLAGRAYDAMKIVTTLLASGTSDALSRPNLLRSTGFAGASGVFRLNADGTNERALAVATFRDGQVVVIDPAPRGFGDAGS